MNIIFILLTFVGSSLADSPAQDSDSLRPSISEPRALQSETNYHIKSAVEQINHEGKDPSCIDRCWDRYDNQGMSPAMNPDYLKCIKECGKSI